MGKRLILQVIALAFTGMECFGQTCLSEEIAYKLKNQAFNHSQIEELSSFMTDDLGPRLAASKMKLRAEKMVVDKLSKMGLTNPHSEFAIKFAKGGWDNECNYVAMTSPYYCSFAANPKAWSGSTNGLVKSNVVLLAYNNVEDLQKYKGKLQGKIVLMPPTQTYEISFKPLASRYTDAELADMAKDPRPMKRRSRYPSNYKELLKLQKQVTDFLDSEKVLAIISGDGKFNVPGSRGVDFKSGNAEPVPQIVLPIEDHGRMCRMLSKGEKVEMELNIRNTFSANDHINNVIAEIPGTDSKLKNEIVLIGAHLDSWHGGTGGADNASGCIVMMEAMRIIKSLGISPKRTIRLALWGGEEQGLYGSRGYSQQYLYKDSTKTKLQGYDKFALYLNMDYGSGRFRGVYLEENDQAVPFFKTWMRPMESLGFNTLSMIKTGGTDHLTFSNIGLPAYQFIQDPLEYGRTYHTVMDTYERLSLDDLKVNAALVAWFALNAAMDKNHIPAKADAF